MAVQQDPVELIEQARALLLSALSLVEKAEGLLKKYRPEELVSSSRHDKMLNGFTSYKAELQLRIQKLDMQLRQLNFIRLSRERK